MRSVAPSPCLATSRRAFATRWWLAVNGCQRSCWRQRSCRRAAAWPSRCARDRSHRRSTRQRDPMLDATSRRLRAYLRAAGSSAPSRLVIPGFIGAAPDGSVTTMGRGGSDLTATLVGRCAARRVVRERRARHPHRGSSYGARRARHSGAAPARSRRGGVLGAKVLHPRALIPLTGTSIPVEVRSFINPGCAAPKSPRAGR